MRQVTGTRELSREAARKQPQRINEKLIYTHGVTMNPVNGFTTEGLPTFLLSNMPVQSNSPSLKVTRPDLLRRDTNNDVREDTSAGVQLPAGRHQQRDVLRRHRQHRPRWILPPTAHRARSGRPREAAVQRRRKRGQPAADAAERPRSSERAGRRIPDVRFRSAWSSETTAGCGGSWTRSRRRRRIRTPATTVWSGARSTTSATA